MKFCVGYRCEYERCCHESFSVASSCVNSFNTTDAELFEVCIRVCVCVCEGACKCVCMFKVASCIIDQIL